MLHDLFLKRSVNDHVINLGRLVSRRTVFLPVFVSILPLEGINLVLLRLLSHVLSQLNRMLLLLFHSLCLVHQPL